MDSLTIKPVLNRPHAEDYDFLRLQGIAALEKLAGDIWTDYNHSDPGITLLEALCYALTDLAYRISLPMADLLAREGTGRNYWENNFYTARQILPCSPLTLNDYRKLIIDTEGVLNAWVEQSLESEELVFIDSKASALTYTPDSNQYLCMKGLYKVYIEYEDAVIREKGQGPLLKLIREKLSHHRNLCEDLVEVTVVQYQLFTVQAILHLHEGADLNQVQAKILFVIKNFFSPPVNFYSLEEMLAKGFTHDALFEGPLLRHGFIDEAELSLSAEFKLTHLSDLVNLLLDIDEIISITSFSIPESLGFIGTEKFPNNDFAAWLTALGQDRKIPQLDILKSSFTYLRSGDRYRTASDQQADPQQAYDLAGFMEGNRAHSRLKGYHPDLTVPTGTFMDTGQYFPVQQTLPHCYQQHYALLGKLAADTRSKFDALKTLGPDKILPLQLKGYLMVFEQILANYFSQLSHLHDLYSFDPGIKSTYFSQLPGEVFDLDYLFTLNTAHFSTHDLPGILEKPQVFADRRERFLDQMAAAYSENLENYSMLMHQLYGDSQASARLIADKALLLQDYVEASNYRFKAFDVSDASHGWNTSNVSGFEKRLCRLLGIRKYEMRSLAISFVKIHPVERENGIQRYQVKIVDPDLPEKILLGSPEYEFQEEAENTLNYMLKNGWNKALYAQEAGQSKLSYVLTRPNDESGTEIVGHKHIPVKEKNLHEATETLKADFERLLVLMNEIAENEGLHCIEHLLLRPRLGPRHSSKKSMLDSDFVDLLPLRNPAVPAAVSSLIPSYTFQVSSTRKGADLDWNIRFTDSKGVEVLHIEKTFQFYAHVLQRITLIRQFGSDAPSYRKILQNDGSYALELWSFSNLLAAHPGTTDEGTLDLLINTLVHFFALESPGIYAQADESDDDPYSYQLTVILPDWPRRFQQPAFRHMLDQTIYLETPAHITVYVQWVGHGVMNDFEEAYKLWVDELAASAVPNAEVVNNLIYELSQIHAANASLPELSGLTDDS